jgi:hypothetical protein
MPIRPLLPQRIGSACLAALALLGLARFASTPAEAWTNNQIARQERYRACTARVQRDPPCNQIWTRYCARECHALYY